MAIITLQDLSSYSGIADMGDKGQTVVNGVNKWVEDYTGRFFGEIKEVTETFDFAPTVFLKHIDITEITSVKVYGQDITTETLCNRETGRIVIRKYGGSPTINIDRSGYDAIEVTYKSGMLEVPVDLKTATLQLAMDNYNRKDGKDANIISTSVGGYSVSYGTAGTTTQSQANATTGVQSAMTDYMAIFNFYRLRSL